MVPNHEERSAEILKVYLVVNMAQKVTHMISTRNILNRATYGFK